MSLITRSTNLFDRGLDGLERLAVTKANDWAALVANIGMCVGLIGVALAVGGLPAASKVLSFLGGLLSFSLIEYSFHRWLFHGPEQALQRGHEQHHDNPMGIGTLPFFLPPLFLLILLALFSKALPFGHALFLTAGIAAGYLAYGQCHDWIHRSRFSNPWLRRWSASHQVHHHHPNRNFGVTSPLWDWLLGTRYSRTSEKSGVDVDGGS